MFTNKNLKFAHGAILTSSMLHEIYKYPREFLRLMYAGYSDGIICGLDYFIEDGNLILSAGIIRLDGEFYFLEENLNISELAEKNLDTDSEYYICLKKSSQEMEPCLTENNIELIFTKEKLNMTLGNFVFRTKEDFTLPQLTNGNDPFENIFKRNVFNFLEIEFAAKDQPTFHPLLFRLVKDFLLKKEKKTPFDYAILTQLQNDEIISIQTIKSYITECGKNADVSDREELFELFGDCLVNSKFEVKYVSDSNQNTDDGGNNNSSPFGRLLF